MLIMSLWLSLQGLITGEGQNLRTLKGCTSCSRQHSSTIQYQKFIFTHDINIVPLQLLLWCNTNFRYCILKCQVDKVNMRYKTIFWCMDCKYTRHLSGCITVRKRNYFTPNVSYFTLFWRCKSISIIGKIPGSLSTKRQPETGSSSRNVS